MFALNIGASATLWARVLFGGLAGAYRFLFAFVSFDLLYSLALAGTPMRTNRYAYIYMIGGALLFFLLIFVGVGIFAEALVEPSPLASRAGHLRQPHCRLYSYSGRHRRGERARNR